MPLLAKRAAYITKKMGGLQIGRLVLTGNGDGVYLTLYGVRITLKECYHDQHVAAVWAAFGVADGFVAVGDGVWILEFGAAGAGGGVSGGAVDPG